ncbi:unnamed protein product [Notodromas monacha]|uniref:C1q domain-containing protein n=1 Tax=Notodromas monacha TaxID=399045 RepID=A0A7R9BU76_9CRUS|nr:unnamed protein product [Notodromas monacha]CAG0921492.1 unnamed protein product [Notodromas monacha]
MVSRAIFLESILSFISLFLVIPNVQTTPLLPVASEERQTSILEEIKQRLEEQKLLQERRQEQIRSLQKQIKFLEAEIRSESSASSEERTNQDSEEFPEHRLDYLEVITKHQLPTTCDHLKRLGHKTSGHYEIDPDGLHGSHDPVLVYCDLEKGLTVIDHNQEQPVIHSCNHFGCTSASIPYQAPLGQMTSLMQLSSHCSQHLNVPQDKDSSGYWEDQEGTKEPFSPAETLDGSTRKRIPLHMLPINVLYVNHTSDGVNHLRDHQVGPLICRGKRSIIGRGLKSEEKSSSFAGQTNSSNQSKEAPLPEYNSCLSLYQNGVRDPGYHWIKTKGGIFRLVFCDMRFILMDSPEGTLSQVTVGPRAATMPVHFHAIRQHTFNSIEKMIPYDNFYTQDPNFDLKVGWFLAPVDGYYRFYFQTINIGTTFAHGSEAYLVRNYNAINGAITTTQPWAVGVTQAVMHLKANDKVYMRHFHGGIFSNQHALTFFTGSLLDPV